VSCNGTLRRAANTRRCEDGKQNTSTSRARRRQSRPAGQTVQLAIAADQRATTMAGIFGAGSVALLAAVATILAATSPNNPFIGGASAMAALFFVAAVTSAM
jgi:hypothetical protein